MDDSGAPTLSRETIVETAIAIVDAGGPGGLSMRMLADRLGVTPMALYNHVASKQDLLRAVASRMLTGVKFDGERPDWRAQVEGCFRALRGVCMAHPGLSRLLEIDGVAPASAFAPMDVTVGALRSAGMTRDDALRVYFALITFTLGQANYQTGGPVAGLEPRAAPGRTNGEKGGAAGAAWDFDRAFEFGMKAFLDGIGLALDD